MKEKKSQGRISLRIATTVEGMVSTTLGLSGMLKCAREKARVVGGGESAGKATCEGVR